MAYAVRLCAVLAAALALPAGAEAAETASLSFTSTGEHALVVPAGVTSVRATLVGGNGGAGKKGAPGGAPATVTATLAVSPGELLYVEVAGNGQSAALETGNSGGYGGGGNGGAASGFGGYGGGGGGGASDLRTCPASAPASACGGHESLGSRLLVAAGGGGAGGNGQGPLSTAGGNGGPADQSGFAGQKDELSDAGGGGGQRGTLTAGGVFGEPTPECKPESPERCATKGQLGAGGSGGSGAIGGGGGGAGGGVFGGGGGGAGASKALANGGGGGGGGGSSGIPAGAAGVSAFSLLPTAAEAQPSVQIAWTMPPPAVSTGAPSAVSAASATLAGSVNPDGSQVSDCHFTLSPAPAGGATLPCVQQVGAGATPVAVSAALGGLLPATAYTVTLLASSVQGAGAGAPVAFTTAAAGAGAHVSVTHLALRPARFRRGRRAATISKAKSPAIGTTISFQLSEAASVTLTFGRAQAGVLVSHRCVPSGKARGKGRRCTRYATVAHTVTRSGHAGPNRIYFDGVLDEGSRLSPGSYRLSLTAGPVLAGAHPAFSLLA
jgi:hypothetical protein